MGPKVAVVLAAGFGTRLQTLFPYKPLVYAPEPLIYYPIQALYYSGVRDLIIVANPWSKPYIESYVERSTIFKTDVKVLWNFWEENGSSLLIGLKEAFSKDDKIVLVMSDHIFEPLLIIKVFTKLKNCKASIAADRNPRWVDINEATKIVTEGTPYAKLFSKSIKKYDYIDTGVFSFRIDILGLIEEAYRRGARKVSDIMNYIAKQEKVCITDVTGAVWTDVDTLDDLLFIAPKVVSRIRRRLEVYLAEAGSDVA